ncbi:LysR family hydrogen peroxide-inducible transcriptional activator [Sphingomonas kaistensis]|uniref:LysR family hydrogen peroxide-inducible transcriptional activator n=1 Tax=Sphingomonas kaistensis TaxID=298708 RepID=A0A7X6BEH9_9SPHN|nr:hydrogen peroxide-inducible genes activator [Sphingomonas kaistensis]NJC04299.1 LysR family hydrogen peroxide-inducible transcriptional activator [Sphingomonas kaistensis]
MTTFLPTLRQLQYLVALHDHGHFGRAAESCFITQSTLSASLRELETLLGSTLVERSRRVTRFTPLGSRIVTKARQVLRSAEELAEMAEAEREPLTGELRMAVIPTIAPFLLPPLLPRLRAAHPSLKLFLREEPSGAACDGLHRGAVDCALLALPFECGEIAHEVLFEDRLLVASSPGELSGDEVRADEISASRLLLLEDGHCLKDHALAACNRPEMRASAMMLGTSLHTLVQMVDNGLGLTLVPQMAVAAGLLEGTGVEVRPLVSDQANRDIALIWRQGSPREAEFRLLADELKRLR